MRADGTLASPAEDRARLVAAPAPVRGESDAVVAPTTPLRVEMIVPSLVGAGMEVMVATLVRALGGRGHTVGVTCLEEEGDLVAGLARDGFRVSLVPTPGIVANAWAPTLAAHLRAVRPDVVHVHSGVWAKGARAARRAGVRTVGHTAHGLLDHEPWHGPAIKRLAARSSDWVAAVSQPLANYLTRDVGIPAAMVSVVPNGIDTERFSPGTQTGELRQRIGVSPSRPLVGTVARLAPVKNQALLLAAFARLRERVPDAALVLIGDGPLRAELEAAAAALGVADDVHFYGAAADASPLYRELDLFVLSSVAEGTSISVLEAMASGVPVVATAVGGTPDLLEHGRCGVLVPSNDAPAMAAAMADALVDRASARRRADDALRRTRTLYSQSAMLSTYEALYRGGRTPPRNGKEEPCVG
ncbi:MAG TPA: glycosyltransferase [Gemmatimonadaceae bacterium]|nr:glycosyltransferase [Gemmatimonadaceae bacterium]